MTRRVLMVERRNEMRGYMQTGDVSAPSVPEKSSFTERDEKLELQLAAGQPNSALAAPTRRLFRHESSAFVKALSPQASAFLAKLQECPAAGPNVSARIVPTRIAEEIFSFADYTLVDALVGPAVDAMMVGMTIPRALKLLPACMQARRERGPGYGELTQRCRDFLAVRFSRMLQSPAWRRLDPGTRDTVDQALRRYIDAALADRARRDLPRLQEAVVHHIRLGRFSAALLDESHVVDWLSREAGIQVWVALAEAGHDVVQLVTRDRADVFRRTTRAGRRQLAHHIWNMAPPQVRDTLWCAHQYGALREAIINSDELMVTDILGRLSALERAEVATEMSVWDAMVQSGDPRMIRCLLRCLPWHARCWGAALQDLAVSGNARAIEAVLQEHTGVVPLLCHDNFAAFRLACAGGHTNAVRTLLRHAALPDAELLAFLRAGFRAAVAEPMHDQPLRAVLKCIEEVAKSRGWNVCGHLDPALLIGICSAGQADILKRMLHDADPVEVRTVLEQRWDAGGRLRSPLAAAAESGELTKVRAILAHVRDPNAAANMVLKNGGEALRAATRSGEVGLVQELIEIALKVPDAWRAWGTREHSERVLRQAMASDCPEMLKFWLHLTPQENHAAIVEGGRLATKALVTNCSRTLRALFEAVGNNVGLKAALVLEAITLDDNIGDVPLALALHFGWTEVVDVVLAQVEAPHRRRSIMLECFDDLCANKTDYFMQHWETFTASERAEAVTDGFLAGLPCHASPGVAVFLMNLHLQAFARALQPLPAHLLHMSGCEAAMDMIRSAPTELRARMLDMWALELLHAPTGFFQVKVFEFLCEQMGRADMLHLLLTNTDTFDHHALRERLAPYVLLGDEWVEHPDIFHPLSRSALLEVHLRDDVNLLREVLARHPQLTGHIVLPVPGPRIGGFIRARAMQAAVAAALASRHWM